MADNETSSLIADLNKQLGILSGAVGQEIKTTGLLSDEYRAETAQAKAMAKAQKELADSIQNATKNVLGFAKTLQNGNGSFQPLEDVVSMTTKALGGLLGKIPFVGGALEGLTKGAGEVANMMIQTFDKVYSSFEKLSDSGVVESFDVFKKTAFEMNMSMTGASEAIEKRSKELALLGGSALQGTKMFKMVAAGSTNLREDFQKLGINSQDFADFQISYINQQNILNGGKKKTTDELIAGSVTYMKELDAVSKLTGESRKNLQKDREERNNEATMLAYMSKLSPEMRDELNEFLDTLKAKGGKEISQAAGLMIARGGRVYGEQSKKLQAAIPEAASMMGKYSEQLQSDSFKNSKAFEELSESADASKKRNSELAIARGNELQSTALFTEINKLSTSKGKNIAALDKEYAKTQEETLKDQESQNSDLAKTKRALENTQVKIENLATSSTLVTGLMGKMAEGIESVTETFYKMVGQDMPEHLQAASEARAAIKEELKTRKDLEKAEKKEKEMKEKGMSEWDPRRSQNQGYLETLRLKLEKQTKQKEEALEKKRLADIKAGIIVGGASTSSTAAATRSTATPTAATTPTAQPQRNYDPINVDQRTPASEGPPADAQGQNGTSNAGYSGKVRNVKPDVLSKLAQVSSKLGTNLVVTSGYRPGAQNHGTGDAVDLGFGPNTIFKNEADRNRAFTAAVDAGFTGIGAEYAARDGAHIHLDTSPKHAPLTGWGSNERSDSLAKDSPFLANLINERRRGRPAGPNSARTGGIFSGPDSGYLTELHGDEIVAPVGKQALNTSMLTNSSSGSEADFDAVYDKMASKLDSLISVMHDNMKANKKQSMAKFV